MDADAASPRGADSSASDGVAQPDARPLAGGKGECGAGGPGGGKGECGAAGATGSPN